MRQFALALLLTGVTFGVPVAANAQYFNFTASFNPNPVTTTQAANYISVIDGSNLSGGHAGTSGTDIGVADFKVFATSNSEGTFNTGITETITLTPTNSVGVALIGDTPVTHVFLANYSGSITNSSTNTTMVGVGPSSQFYSFADGSVFEVSLTSYSGPGFNGGFTDGALGGHVTGALGGVPQHTPEPGSLALVVGFGITGCLLLPAMRRRALNRA